MSYLRERTSLLYEVLTTTEYTSESNSLIEQEAFDFIYEKLNQAKKESHRVFVIGNGGSAGIASHHVVDLVNVLKVPAMTLSDNNLITCMGNDYGYESIYSRPLQTLASKGDILIAISSSGSSDNILEACRVMKAKSGYVITLSGFKKNNPLRSLGDLNIWTEIEDYGLVESAHFFILHTLVDGWSRYLQNIREHAAIGLK